MTSSHRRTVSGTVKATRSLATVGMAGRGGVTPPLACKGTPPGAARPTCPSIGREAPAVTKAFGAHR